MPSIMAIENGAQILTNDVILFLEYIVNALRENGGASFVVVDVRHRYI